MTTKFLDGISEQEKKKKVLGKNEESLNKV